MMAYKPYDVELLGLDLYLKCYIANNFFPPFLSENNVDVYVYKIEMQKLLECIKLNLKFFLVELITSYVSKTIKDQSL